MKLRIWWEKNMNTVYPQIVSAETIFFQSGLMYCCDLYKSAETIQARKLFAEIR